MKKTLRQSPITLSILVIFVTFLLQAEPIKITDITQDFLTLHPNATLLPKITVRKAFQPEEPLTNNHEGLVDLYVYDLTLPQQPQKIAKATYQKREQKHVLDYLKVEDQYQGKKVGFTLAKMALLDHLPNCRYIYTIAMPIETETLITEEKEQKLQRIIKFYKSLGGEAENKSSGAQYSQYMRFNNISK